MISKYSVISPTSCVFLKFPKRESIVFHPYSVPLLTCGSPFRGSGPRVAHQFSVCKASSALASMRGIAVRSPDLFVRESASVKIRPKISKFVQKFSKNFQKKFFQKILVISKYSIISPNCLCDSSRRPSWALAGLAIAADGPSSPHQARDSSRRPVKALLGPGITLCFENHPVLQMHTKFLHPSGVEFDLDLVCVLPCTNLAVP